MPKKWRKGEFAMCGFKNRYRSRTAAEEKAERAKRFGDPTMQSYKCPFCRTWHIGHSRGGNIRTPSNPRDPTHGTRDQVTS